MSFIERLLTFFGCLVIAATAGVIMDVFFMLMSLYSTSGGIFPLLAFIFIVLSVGFFLGQSLKLIIPDQKEAKSWQEVGSYVCIFVGIGFFIGNFGNHFYSPGIFRIAFYSGLIALYFWCLSPFKKWILLAGVSGVLIGASSLLLEDHYRYQFYSQCENPEEGVYICDGLKMYAQQL